MSPIADMPGNDGCGGDLAAYALGAMDPQEAEAFRSHMEQCAVCREEMESLGQLVNVLPMAAPQQPVPRSLRRRVLAEVRADARTRKRSLSKRHGFGRVRTMALATSTALVVAAAAIAGVELASVHGSGTHVYAATVGDAQLRVSGGQAQLIVRRLAQPSAGHIYEVWLQHGSQRPSPTKALFSVTAAGDGQVAVPGGVHGVTAVLVTQEPDGGTQVPTTSPVIVARLS